MEEKTEIHAVELVRHIRDEQSRALQGKSPEEIIEFFRRAAEEAKSEARGRRTKTGEPTHQRGPA